MIPRHLLPQIPNDQIDAFKDFLIGNGVRAAYQRVEIQKLRPIQSEFNRDKVDSLKQDHTKLVNPLVITAQGFVIDGHHRYVALKELDPTFRLTCLVCYAPLRTIIELAHQFDGSFTKTVYESTTYIQTQ